MSLATYTFTSLVRRGFTPDATGQASVTVRVDGQPDLTRGVAMMTPADVTGIAPGQVLRTWPQHGVHDAEPNYLALVELDSPDLPWLFSRPRPDGRVLPWMVLAVVELDPEASDPLRTDPVTGRTTITVPKADLPDPSESWLWAHAQLLGTDTVPDDPTRSLARLLCPRRLLPDSHYVAVVVPTFESGRLAGLGEHLDNDDPRRASPTLAWEGSGTVTLPVYFSWRFSTGRTGDFEALVRRLHGVPLLPEDGRRRLRLDHASSNLPRSGAAGDIDLHVALRPLATETEPIEEVVEPAYLTALKSRLADADYDVSLLEGTMPRVGPPVHGQLPVGPDARARNLDTDRVPPWLRELNGDPRHRVAAGLGAEVVRRNQEHYMEEAWRQVGDVLAANRLRRRAEYSVAATSRLFSRWISRLDTPDLVTATAPVHAKVLTAPGETVVGRLRDSPLPPAVVSVELRRFARQRGALSHATRWQEAAGVTAVARRSTESEPLVQRVPLDSIEALEPPSRVWGELRAKDVLTRLVADGDSANLDPRVAAGRLDAVSRVTGVDIPPTEAVAERVSGTSVDLDRTMTSIGLLPRTAVIDAITREQPVPPEPPPTPPDRIRDRDPFDPFEPFRPGREEREGRDTQREGDRLRDRTHIIDVTDHIERLVVRREGHDLLDLRPRLRPVEVLDTVTEHPDLVTRFGDTVVLDTVLLDNTSRRGRTATSIDPAVFDRLVDGTFRPEEPPAVGFDVPGSRRAEVGAELGRVVISIADQVIRPEDVATRPGRTLEGGLESLREPLLRALDPRTSIMRAVNSRIEALRDPDEDALDDIMAAPDLSEPTYQQLAAISHDWLLPGIDKLPADTTTLVAANLDFIAAFLVGVNHELARELLWREYPTDQRGTYARQFWTHRVTRDREDQLDLKRELHRARRSSLAGLTVTSPPASEPEVEPEPPLVLVVKGELVQRYPGVMITASQTTRTSSGDRVPAGTPRVPGFLGLLAPDVMLVGFPDLTEREVRDAEADPDLDKRWWFFFAEHFTEPRFGLDEPPTVRSATPASWNDADWLHVPPSGSFLTAASSALDLLKGVDPARPSLRWGSSAAAQAWITLQFPFRRGMPARILLPPEGES